MSRIIVPDPITVLTGDSAWARFERELFILATRKTLESRYGTKPLHFELKEGELVPGDGRESDDRVSYLLCNDQIAGCVFETRTTGNMVRYTFMSRLEEFKLE